MITNKYYQVVSKKVKNKIKLSGFIVDSWMTLVKELTL